MTTVWLPSRGVSARAVCYHTDKECPYLNAATNVIEKELSVLNGHKDLCKWCDGAKPPRNTDPMKRVRVLDELDPEDV